MKKPLPLSEFYKDTATKDNVHAYLTEFVKEEAVRMLMNREDVTGVALTNELIDKAFEHMDELFGKKVNKKNIINEAR